MTTNIIEPIKPEINRDRWGRPLVTPPDGGKPVAYTRCTTFVSSMEDRYNLERWQQRMVATGLADRADLLLAAAAARDDKRTLNRVCNDAIEAAKGSAKATTGTALHSLTERADRDLDMPVLPPDAQADVDAYVIATASMRHVHIEQFTVNDELQVGGTPDRVAEFAGGRYIADLKTGSIKWGALKIAQQLAMYANSVGYRIEDGSRFDLDVDRERAIVIHLPAGTAQASLYWIDIATGWEAVQVSGAVRDWRKRDKPDGLLTLIGPDDVVDLGDKINNAPTVDALNALYHDNVSDWTDRHTSLAVIRKSHLTDAAVAS